MLNLKLQDKTPCSEIRKKNKDNWHYKIKVEMGRTHSKNEGR